MSSIRRDISLEIGASFSTANSASLGLKPPNSCPENSSIINFSSTYGILSPKHFIYPEGFTKHIGYSITKSGVIGLTQYLSTYLAPKIRVNAIVPGGVENNQSTEFIKQYSALTPMGRMMKKEEIIGLVKYLASDDSLYTTGSILKVDGGWSAW